MKHMPKTKKSLKQRLTKTARRCAYGVKRRLSDIRQLGRLIKFAATDEKENPTAKDWLRATYDMMVEPVLSKLVFQPATEVRRLASFVPVLWRNYDWEGTTIIPLLEHKLRRMRHCFAALSTRAPNDTIVAEIDEVLELLRAAREDARKIAKEQKKDSYHDVEEELLGRAFALIAKNVHHWWD